MSAVAPTAASPRTPLPATQFRGKVTQAHEIRSEWTKLWSLRSTRWALFAAALAMIALGPGIAAAQMHRWATMSAFDRAHYDSIDNGVGGWHLAQLAIGVLGVMIITGEYTTGMIKSSMMAAPKRLPVLWAKLAVFMSVTLVLTLVTAFISFFAVQAIVTGHHVQHSLGDPHALRAVIGVSLALTMLSAFAIGIGTLIRNTAGGIAAFAGLLFVLPGISALLPASLNNQIGPYLPLNAAFTVATSSFDVGSHHLSYWGGFLVFSIYTAIVVAAAAVQLVRRDV
jgi:ABC-2 type transport system permease protein